MKVWLFAAAAAILIAVPREVAGQARITTRTAVYTQPQAMRGRDVYVAYCKQCHTPESHTGKVFHATWNGRRLWDLYAFVRDRMPKTEPGSLSDEEYADVVAYLLKMNQMPSGKYEMPSDSARLASIRIATRAPIKVTKSTKGSAP